MTTYFSDREFGPEPKVKGSIDGVVWQAILSLIGTKVSDGSLAYGFPSHCPDGNAIEGTDQQAMWSALRAEIPKLADQDPEGWDEFCVLGRSSDETPSTPAILDLVQFVAREGLIK